MSAAKTEGRKDVIRFGEKDLKLEPDDPRYNDGMKCVLMYWAQATKLNTREQEEMVKYMWNRDYVVSRTARMAAVNHKLYRVTMRAFEVSGLEGLSWPIYLILASIYDKLPKRYALFVMHRFNFRAIEDHTQEYLSAISDEEGALVTATLASSANLRPSWAMINKLAVATNTTMTMTVDGSYAISGTEEQVASLKPVHRAKQSVALERSKRLRALSDISAIEPKRTRLATDKGGFDIGHVVTGVKSSLAIQRFADAAKSASIIAKKPRMTSSDLLKMKEDVKIAKETAIRSEAKLDGFLYEMRQFMTAFANTAGVPLPIEVVDESDNDNHERGFSPR
ncbi:hypothetical protein HDV62DRAFT_401696 [Trichoderma sp. SZMC 28011]